MSQRELWIATHNKNKMTEIKELLKGIELSVHGAFELPHYTPPPETGKTFQENAQIKARFLKAMKPDAWVLADDSGLEVPALRNLPGVHSARYAGPHARDIENTVKLLKQLQIQTSGNQRDAHFKCVVSLLSPDGQEKFFEGLLKGQIAKEMKGKNGFGYDPIFIPENNQLTMAELTLAEKNKLSHRALALKQVRQFLESAGI